MKDDPRLLVSTEWLHDNLANVRVLDASWYLPAMQRDARAEHAAAHIPGARFLPLETPNHLLLEGEPAWQRWVDEFRAFLPAATGTPRFDMAATGMLFVPEPARPIAFTEPGIGTDVRSWERKTIASGCSSALPTLNRDGGNRCSPWLEIWL